MKRLVIAALALSVATASCSGARSASALLPSAGMEFGGNAPASKEGARSTRAVATAPAPAGWSSTATQPVSFKSATDLGALDPSKTLTVRLGLQMHNVDQLKAVVKSRGRITPAQFTATYGPTPSEVAQVTSYLQSQGLSNIVVEPNNLLVSATGSAASVGKAFNTTLNSFTLDGATVFANTTAAYVPTALNGIVVAVLGLNNVQLRTPMHTSGVLQPPSLNTQPGQQPESPCALSSAALIGFSSPKPEPTPQAYTTGCLRANTPSDYWRAYDVNTTPPASGVNIAIMAEGNVAPAIADFRVNEQGDGLAQVPVVVKQVGIPSPDTAGAGEWTLDMIASSGMAGAVNTIYLYATTSLTDSDIALEYNHWVTDNLAPIGNSSFGGCEVFAYVDGSMLVDDMALLQGAAQGQTMFASTGDSGGNCSVGVPNGVPAGAPMVEYPSASAYAVAVGGTTLVSQVDGTYQGVAAWYSGGGGVSQFEYSPYWEQGVQPISTTPAGLSFRGSPDVAMDGDLQTGLKIYEGGRWTITGGTSLSSPLMAGVWARMLQSHPGLGYAPPLLYHAFAVSNPGTKYLGPPVTINQGPFHDIINGSNGPFQATPGWDFTTGLGSVDVDALNATIGT
jgi:pseudomonalisin